MKSRGAIADTNRTREPAASSVNAASRQLAESQLVGALKLANPAARQDFVVGSVRATASSAAICPTTAWCWVRSFRASPYHSSTRALLAFAIMLDVALAPDALGLVTDVPGVATRGSEVEYALALAPFEISRSVRATSARCARSMATDAALSHVAAETAARGTGAGR